MLKNYLSLVILVMIASLTLAGDVDDFYDLPECPLPADEAWVSTVEQVRDNLRRQVEADFLSKPYSCSSGTMWWDKWDHPNSSFESKDCSPPPDLRETCGQSLNGCWNRINWHWYDPKNPDAGVDLKPNHVDVSNGSLILRVPAGAPPEGAQIDSVSSDFYYGLYEGSIKIAHPSGVINSIFWYSHEARKTEAEPFEIDIEFVTRQKSGAGVAFVTHAYDSPGVKQKDGCYIDLNELGIDPSQSFHTYGFVWQGDPVGKGGWIGFLVDQEVVAILTKYVPSRPGTFILNNWTGNPGWGGGPPQTEALMVVDWVRYVPYAPGSLVVPEPTTTQNASTATALVVDISGSMHGIKIDSAKSAAQQIINMLDQESQAGGTPHRVSVITFNDIAYQNLELTSNYDSARSVISVLLPFDGTNIGDGLTVANQSLSNASVDEKKIVILLSDGEPTEGMDEDEIIARPVKDAVNAGACIYTIGFGEPGQFDEDLLQRIASSSGCGDYYHAANVDELERIYVRIRHVSTGNLLAEHTGHVSQGETIRLGTFEIVKGLRELIASLFWPGSALDLHLIDPRGRTVDQNYPGANIAVYPNHVYMLVENPVAGTWQMDVYGRQVPEGTIRYDALVSTREGAVPPASSPGLGIVVVLFVFIVGGVGIYLISQRRSPGLMQRAPQSPVVAASLIFVAGPLKDQVLSFSSPQVSVGRGKGSGLHLADRSVSRQHARLRHARGAWFIQDLGSASGTFVNDRRIQAQRLNPGDRITIGSTTFIFKES
jgi:Mg-chelatase subunit ChlD